MINPLITLKNIRVSRGNLEVIRGLNASLARGKVTSLIGLNGAGKSTLLRAIVKEIPYLGEMRFHCGHSHVGTDPTHVGYVPQRLRPEGGLPLTVADFFALGMQTRPVFWGVHKTVKSKFPYMLEKVGLSPNILDRVVDKLSGGELQRVLLALAMEPSPELLLLDEPAAGIDFQDQEKFYQLIRRINEQSKVTVLLVSHDLDLVLGYADEVWCLHDGKILKQGSPAEVLNKDHLHEIFGAGFKVH